MNSFLCNKRYFTYVHDDRRICTNTYVFHRPPLERAGNRPSSNYLPTMPREQFTEEYESLKTCLELSEACRDHYKTDRDYLKVEIAKFKDGSENRNYEPSFPPVCRAEFHDLSIRDFGDTSGNSKQGKESLNLQAILLERLTELEKTITLQKQELQKLRNDFKNRDSREKELENSIREHKAENKNLQGVQEELKKRERELTKNKDELQLVLKKLNETKTELSKVQKLKYIEQRSKEDLERKARTNEKDLKHLRSINEINLKKLKLEHDLKSKEQEIKSLQKLLERKTDEASDCKSLRSRLQETKGVLSALSNKHEQTLQNLKQALAKVEEIKKERDSDRVANHNLEKQIQQLKNEIEQFHLMVKDQKEISKKSKMEDIERSEMEKELKKNEIQITSLNDQLHQAKRKLTETESELREMKTRRFDQNLQTQERSLKKEIEQLHLKANRQVAAVSKTSKMEDSERSEMEEELKKRELQITSLKDQLQQAKRNLMETESELREMKTMRSDQTLQNEVQYLKKEIEQLQLRANRQEAAVSKTSKLKDSERSAMEEELKKRELQITSLNDQLQQTKRKLTETESELREMKTMRPDQNLQNEVHRLKKEIEQLHLNANRQEAAVSKTSKMKDIEISEMEEELKKRALQISSLNDQLQQTKRKLTDTESELREMKTMRFDQSLQNEVQRLKNEIEQLHLKANRQEAAVLNSSKMEDSERSVMEEELKKREVQITFLNDHLKQEKRKLMETESELQETKTRLSKAMGNKLTDNNPNIADLSDKNRPVKLAERFGELYDNQWTDAYDIIDKYFDTEEQTLGELFNILQKIFCFCKTSWAKQMEDLLKALWFSANPEDVSPEVNKTLKDCKKTTAAVAVRNLYEIYIARLQHSAEEISRIALEIRPFVQECLEICWLMMIQDPPVVFAPIAGRGSKLNTDIYKPYTKSGTHVEYTVWPAMLLHENGPVLAKGVAQGYKNE